MFHIDGRCSVSATHFQNIFTNLHLSFLGSSYNEKFGKHTSPLTPEAEVVDVVDGVVEEGGSFAS